MREQGCTLNYDMQLRKTGEGRGGGEEDQGVIDVIDNLSIQMNQLPGLHIAEKMGNIYLRGYTTRCTCRSWSRW